VQTELQVMALIMVGLCEQKEMETSGGERQVLRSGWSNLFTRCTVGNRGVLGTLPLTKRPPVPAKDFDASVPSHWIFCTYKLFLY
jgi:hypothetical protein